MQSSTTSACREHVDHLRELGHQLWVFGYLIGPDRPAGLSPGGFGDDGIVALGLLAQMTAELGSGAIVLLGLDNRYGAAALIRQLIELGYLAWWMFEHPTERHRWIRASADELRTEFSPAALRRLAKGKFRKDEYHRHCALGGHPDPLARVLLPDHAPALGCDDLAGDLLHHLAGIRCYLDETKLTAPWWPTGAVTVAESRP